MAWKEPVTDRASTKTYTTYKDMNRIGENINIAYGASCKVDYTWQNIVLDTEWNKIIIAATAMATELGLEAPTDSTHYTNLNYIEEITKQYYERESE